MAAAPTTTAAAAAAAVARAQAEARGETTTQAQTIGSAGATSVFYMNPEDITLDHLPGRRKKHPLYSTSNSDYGKTGLQAKKPEKWAGRQGQFTNDFHNAGMYRNCGLNTTTTRHTVLPQGMFGNPAHADTML
jgi:hypothetical protein